MPSNIGSINTSRSTLPLTACSDVELQQNEDVMALYAQDFINLCQQNTHSV